MTSANGGNRFQRRPMQQAAADISRKQGFTLPWETPQEPADAPRDTDGDDYRQEVVSAFLSGFWAAVELPRNLPSTTLIDRAEEAWDAYEARMEDQ